MSGAGIENPTGALFIMKLSQEQTSEIKERFNTIKDVEDFCSLLSFISKTLNPDSKKEFLISVKEVIYFSIHKDEKYFHFSIPKKDGTSRLISAPGKRLKKYQRLINALLNAVYEPHKSAFGFVPKKNIVDNAKKHISKRFVYNIDLEGFFPSIKFRRVKSVLELSPFNLTGHKENLAFIIANICCAHRSLPQGAPTSPTLTNIVCQRLDRRLFRFAIENKATYSRYADDITFSSFHEIFNDEFKTKLNAIIVEEKFIINEKKIRLQSRGERQSVTGVIVNSKSNLSKNYVNRVRFWLYIWKKFGYDKASLRFIDDYNGKIKRIDYINEKSITFKERFSKEKGSVNYKGRTPDLKSVLAGKINFLSMVKGKEDVIVIKYKKQLNELIAQSNQPDKELTEIERNKLLQIIDIWESNGIESAQELYKINYES